MVYDTGYRKLPHRCGAVQEYCILEEDQYIIYFCSLCRLVIGYEKDGVRVMKGDETTKFKQKQYSDKTIKDLQ
ncbi:MAG TPA: hypothetical protein VL854_08035 [Nitrososphaeraceae archaeon]|nr:hypothetical protein [Nitrososphaeraceae archaeon]